MKRTKRGEVMMNLLRIVGVAGILVTGALCPNLLLLLRGSCHKRYSYQSCQRALIAIDTHRWILAKKTDAGVHIYLTKRGQAELLACELGEKNLKNKGCWDGKWHLLIFDIEEKRKCIRNRVRCALINLGLYRLQDSVWVYPYDCHALLELLRIKYRVWNEALYLRAEHLDNDRGLRRHFGLKSAR